MCGEPEDVAIEQIRPKLYGVVWVRMITHQVESERGITVKSILKVQVLTTVNV